MTDTTSGGTIPTMAKDPTKRAPKRPWSDTLARRIRLARGKVTQEKLAERLGISKASLSSWESGDTAPSVDNLDQLSRELRVSMDWLMGRGSDDLPSMMAVDEQVGRRRIAEAASAVLEVLHQERRIPSPEDLAVMILAAHDWAAGDEQKRGAPPAIDEIAAFVRHAMKMH